MMWLMWHWKMGITTIIIARSWEIVIQWLSRCSPNTAHTTNPVPVILVDNELHQINDGILGDIAPTVLKLIGIPQPAVMTQKSLI